MRAEDRRATWTGIALLRLALVLVIGAGQALGPQGEARSYFTGTFVIAAVYATATVLTATGEFRPRWLPWAEAGLDVVLLCLLTIGSGGPDSEARRAFLALPVAAAFLSVPRKVAAWAIFAVVAFLLITVFAHTGERSVRTGLVQSLYLAWTGAGAVVLSTILTRRADRIAALAESRRQLISTSLDIRDRERRRLAQALHDEPVQALLAARQDLEEARLGDQGGLDRGQRAVVAVVANLREAIFDLHPPALDAVGLEAALQAYCAEQSRRGGYEISVTVDSRLRFSSDPLPLALLRELIGNVTKHAAARRVRVEVRGCQDGGFLLEVADDGRGMTQDRRRREALDGHIGLSSVEERVKARAGVVEINSEPGAGTRVGVRLPAPDQEKRVRAA